MSSRAAASRQRLEHGESSQPSSSKGFFSRSKTSRISSSPVHSSDQRIVSPTTSQNSFNLDNDPHLSHYYSDSDPTVNDERSQTSPTKPSLSPYPSPPHDWDGLTPHQAIRLRGSGRNDYGAGVTYIKASYQPPPPIQASYQPPPPSQSIHTNMRHGITDFSGKPTLADDSRANANVEFALPSPLASPAHSPIPLPLRESSPTPTELPTYSSVHEVPFSTRSRAVQAIIESPSRDSANTPTARAQYQQYYHSPSYAPVIPRSQRLTPSPLQIPDMVHSPSGTPLSSEHDFRQAWPRGLGLNGSSSIPSPAQSTSQRPSSPSVALRPVRPPTSISDSSDSSGSKSPASSKEVLAVPAFVFPGSRSIARPKVSAKTGNPTIKKSKTKWRTQKETDPPPTQGFVSDEAHDEHPEPSSAVGGRSPNIGGTTPASLSSDDSLTTPAKKVYPMGRSRARPSKSTAPKVKDSLQPSSKSSSSSGSGDHDGRSKFMGLLRRKKNPKAGSSNGSTSFSQSSGFDVENDNHPADVRPPSSTTLTQEHENDQQPHSFYQEGMERARRIKSRIGTYPLDPYDSVLLDNDRHTGELLVRLNPTNSPCFYNYGNNPPASVLDLGCGQGHWAVDAAIAWKGYGTRVTGYDMVDISQGLLPWAVEQGVADSIRFVRGNFLKHRLPFSDGSFDLVRMSCLALCITSDSWVSVLQEVYRVLIVGGRLELIDDHVFFPYGKVSPVSDISGRSEAQSIPPRLDISIPSASFTTFSIYDGDTTNPGLGPDDEDEDDFFDYYANNEDDAEFDDTATLNGRESETTPSQSRGAVHTQRMRTSSPAVSAPLWNRAHSTAGDVEALFEHMLAHKFGIRKDLHNFVLDLMKDVFGHAREVKTMHLVLAPPETGFQVDERPNSGGSVPDSQPTSSRASMGLSTSPGLILWPSTFIPMDQSEIEIHASKHLRMLLSCKSYLLEHAIEATDDVEIDEGSVREALWEYEGFLRCRFNPPPLQTSSDDPNDLDFDAVSIRGSIAESDCEAMWEIQSDFRRRFGWQRSASTESSTSRSPTPTRTAPTNATHTPTPISPVHPLSSPIVPNPSSEEHSVPLYSRDELTHVRTFRIYEAIKIDQALFGSAM